MATSREYLPPSAASIEAVTAQPETYINTSVIIEKRRVGDMRYTVALADHSPENIPDVALALKDCDVILVESVGADDAEDRETTAQLLTMLTSENTNPDIIDVIMAKATAAAKAKGRPLSFALTLASQLRGTNKFILPIDMNKDDPGYGAVQVFEQAVSETSFAGYTVARVHDMRQKVRDMTTASVTANAIRDKRMAGQILTAHYNLANSLPQAKVGIAVGKGHYNVLKLTGLDDEAQAEVTQSRVLAASGPHLQAHIEERDGKEPSTQLVDRIALGRYIETIVGSTNRSGEYIRQVTDDEVDILLGQMDKIAQDPDEYHRHLTAKYFLDGFIKRYNPQSHAVPNTYG